jgi:hypothetical protein
MLLLLLYHRKECSRHGKVVFSADDLEPLREYAYIDRKGVRLKICRLDLNTFLINGILSPLFLSLSRRLFVVVFSFPHLIAALLFWSVHLLLLV